MGKVRWMGSRVAPALVLLCIGASPSQYQHPPNKALDIQNRNRSILVQDKPFPVVLRQDKAARPYSPCQAPKPPRPRRAPGRPPDPLTRVEPIYPEKAKYAGIGGLFMAIISANEAGEVTNARVVGRCPPGFSCPPELEEAVLAAVRLWRYLPVFEDGGAITQSVSAVVIFDPRTARSGSGLNVKVDSRGELFDIFGEPIRPEVLKTSNSIIVTCESSTPFAVLESTLKNLELQGIKNLHLSSWSYAFAAGRLFYRFLCGAEKGSNPLDDIHPPSLEIDVNHLALIAKTSGSSTYLPSFSVGGGLLVPVTYISYVIYVSQRGEIIEIERTGGPVVTNVEEELRHAAVLQPGQRGNAPVAATISVFIPIK
jgi:TonB family protein